MKKTARTLIASIIITVSITSCAEQSKGMQVGGPTLNSSTIVISTPTQAPAQSSIGSTSQLESSSANNAVIATLNNDAPVSGTAQQLADYWISRLPEPILTAKATDPPADEAAVEPAGWGSGIWLAFNSTATDEIDQVRATWETPMVVGDVWRSLPPDAAFRGGELQPSNTDGSSGMGKDGAKLIIREASSMNYQGPDGKPSKLLIGEGEDQVRANAIKAGRILGLDVAAVKIWQLRGAVVELDMVAHHPATFVCQNPNSVGGLGADLGQAEGVLIIVKDDDGALVAVSATNAAQPGGFGGNGTKYVPYADSKVLMQTTAPQEEVDKLCQDAVVAGK